MAGPVDWAPQTSFFSPKKVRRWHLGMCFGRRGSSWRPIYALRVDRPSLDPLTLLTRQQWRGAIADTVAQFGRLDVLVNNAAVGGAGTIEETSVEEWNRVMAVNVTGVFLGTKVAIPEMRKSGGGSIINISSQMGIVGSQMSNVVYQTSKGAIRMFTKAAAIHHAKDGIRVNSVHPGPILTRRMEMSLADNSRQEDYYLERVPLGRLGSPQDVAYCVLYLASDESAFVTGSEQLVDGGWTAQ